MDACGPSEWLTFFAVFFWTGFALSSVLDIVYLTISSLFFWRKTGCSLEEEGGSFSYSWKGDSFRSKNKSISSELILFSDKRQIQDGGDGCFVNVKDPHRARLFSGIYSRADFLFVFASLAVIPGLALVAIPGCLLKASISAFVLWAGLGTSLWAWGRFVSSKAARSEEVRNED